MFDDDGFMRSTPKSIIKSEIAVERSARGLDFGAQVIDGCTHIWAVPYPTAAKATVQIYVDACSSCFPTATVENIRCLCHL